MDPTDRRARNTATCDREPLAPARSLAADRRPAHGSRRARVGSRATSPRGRCRRGRARARWALPLGAVAAVLLAASSCGRSVFDGAAPARDDVDGSGRVDILDVLALARMRAAGDAAGVTEARIEELAYRIVAIDAPRSLP